MIVLDTSVLLAYILADDRWHRAVSDWLDRDTPDLATTPLALAEMDHMAGKYGGVDAAALLRHNVEAQAFDVVWPDNGLRATLAVARRRPDIGLTDASLVALAGHLGTKRIATLDQRHFRRLQPLTGEAAFTLLPADAD